MMSNSNMSKSRMQQILLALSFVTALFLQGCKKKCRKFNPTIYWSDHVAPENECFVKPLVHGTYSKNICESIVRADGSTCAFAPSVVHVEENYHGCQNNGEENGGGSVDCDFFKTINYGDHICCNAEDWW